MEKKLNDDNRGAVALLSVLIIGAVVLILAKSSAYVGRADLDMVNNSIQAGIAMSNAESCLEEALAQIRHDNEFQTTGTNLSLNDGTCFFRVRSDAGTFHVYSEGRLGSYLKKLELRAFFDSGNFIISSRESK